MTPPMSAATTARMTNPFVFSVTVLPFHINLVVTANTPVTRENNRRPNVGCDDGDLRRLNGSGAVRSGREPREERNCLMSDRPDCDRKQHGAKTD